jgi:ADP-ribose pyrophosphatase
MKKWTLISSRPTFESKWMTIKSNDYELPNGKLAKEYLHLDRPDYVLIVAHKDNSLLVEKQYRRGVDDFVYELPAGWIDKDETPEKAASRELKEETGYLGKAAFLGTIYPQPGFSSMLAHIVEVQLNDEITDRELENDERIEFEFIEFNNLDAMVVDGKCKDMGMLAALNLFKQTRDKSSQHHS